jgi:hypothetical protein
MHGGVMAVQCQHARLDSCPCGCDHARPRASRFRVEFPLA